MYVMLKYARYLFHADGDEGGGGGGGGGGGDEGGGSASLLDGAPATEEGGTKPAEDGRPEWLTDDRFWDKDGKAVRNEQMHKSYKALEEKLGGHKGSPRDAEGKVAYDLTITEDLLEKVSVNAEDPLLTGVTEIAEKYGVSQECFSELLNAYAGAEYTKALEQYSAEMSSLGANAADAVKSVVDWGSAHLDKENYALLKSGCTTADAVRMAQMLIQNNGAPQTPTEPGTVAASAPASGQQFVEQIDQAKYKTDPNYRSEVDKGIQAWDDKGAAG